MVYSIRTFATVTAGLALLSLASLSQAVSITLHSLGTYATSGTTQTSTETVFTSPSGQIGGFGPLASLVLNYDTSTLSGTGTYTGTGGALNFDFSLAYPPSVTGQGFSYAAVWSTGQFNANTGTYAGVTGVGTFSVTLNTKTMDSGTDFTGDVQAVPEPASLAALAVGGVTLLRRRKRA